MGGLLSKNMGKVMDDNMKKNQDFMLATQKMQLERQIEMQLQMRNRAMAQQLGRARDMFNWYAAFYGLAAFGLTAGFLRTRRPWTIIPLVPLSFIVGYQADLALGNKMERILKEADHILSEETHMLRLPGEPLSVALIDRERQKK